jgi:CDP-diacylglycerol--glycerol-3-phosphate 3-phosphatidyltransferase
MIKTTALLVLVVRYLRSNRRAAIATAFSQMLVQGGLLARRVGGNFRLRIPGLLVAFRAALGPCIILISLVSKSGMPLTVCIAMALLSDFLDGFLARRWNMATEALRRWDTRADTFFYACVFGVMLLRYPAAVQQRWALIAGLVIAEVLQHVFAAVKYGRHASYHSILSKIWGLMMAAATIALLGFGVDNWFLDVALGWGILCNLQGLAMTLLLPTWQHDVLTLFHAVRLRNKINRERADRLEIKWVDGGRFI